MATSSGFEVWFSDPWVMMTSVAADLVPSPICRPAPTVDWLCAAPGVTRFWYTMSWNCSRSCRNPVVDELARLLAIVSRFICCALIPLAAVYNALIMFLLALD